MAQHTVIKNRENKDLVKLVNEFMTNTFPFVFMIDFLRYNKDGKLMGREDLSPENKCYQKLTDRYERGDTFVLSISPVDINYAGAVFGNAIAEIHVKKNRRKIYLVY